MRTADCTRRLLVTLGIVACAHTLKFVPILGTSPEVIGPSVLSGWVVVERDSFALGMASLGFVPYKTGLDRDGSDQRFR